MSCAMAALETGSSYTERREAWNGLRDLFFPQPTPPVAGPAEETT